MSTRPPDEPTTRYVYVREDESRYVIPRNAPPRNQILLLLMLLLLVLLIAVAMGRGLLLRFGGVGSIGTGTEELSTRVSGATTSSEVLSSNAAAGGCRQFAETNRQICGRIRQFYEQNGDMAAFGQPLSNQQTEVVEGRSFQAQWFERGRIELHPENLPPYDVLLGRLGAESLGRAGLAWNNFPAASQTAPYFFPRTNQAIAPEFWSYWSTRGLNFDSNGASSFEESLALFGYPISGALRERAADGRTYLTQWFERARFEYHPEASAPNQVQVELFGTKLLSSNTTPGSPYPTPTQ